MAGLGSSIVQSYLANTPPIAKKIKYTVVTEAHKECTCAAYAPANLLQKANSGSNWRLSSEQVGGTEWAVRWHLGISPYPAPHPAIRGHTWRMRSNGKRHAAHQALSDHFGSGPEARGRN